MQVNKMSIESVARGFIPANNSLGPSRTGQVGRLFFFFLPILSGAMLVLAFPKFNLPGLAWVGFVPLLISISRRSAGGCFLSSYVCGMFFFTGVFYWAFAIPGYHVIHHIILALYSGIYFALFGLAFAQISNRLSAMHAHIAAPFIWVCLEYLRSNFTFLALPWPLLAHSQYQNLRAVQLAPITGAYGVSFLVFLVNASVTLVISTFLDKRYKRSGHQVSENRRAFIIIAGAATLICLSFLYGQSVLSEPVAGKSIKVSVIQGNVDRQKKANPRKHSHLIMQIHKDLTRKVSRDQPDLIVWPEAATPGFVLKNRLLLGEMSTLIKKIDTYFLVGSSEYSKFAKTSPDRNKVGNTALFYSPKGKVLGQYLKIRLLPFGEYLPYEGTISWPDFIVPKERRNWDSPGNEFTLFDLNGVKFGTIICWENAFPDLFRKFVKAGANFMLNITNEGWFGETAAPYQFLAMCVFRAVENRIYLARAANTGISCFIDPYGRITGRVMKNGKDIFVDGYLTRNVHLSEAKTFYTFYGDVFVYICILTVAVFAAACFRKK